MAPGPTRDEFTSITDRLFEQMRDGFEGVNARLDRQNGRITTVEVKEAEDRTRVISLEKEIFSRGRGRRLSDQVDSDDAPAVRFTKRESALMMAGLGIIFSLIKLIEFIGEKAYAAFTHGVKP
jgi:hypothetical protein